MVAVLSPPRTVLGMDITQQRVRTVAAYLDGLGVKSEDLDEQVHEKKGREAAHINNGGLHAQLTYLLSGASSAGVEEYLARLLVRSGVDPRLVEIRLQ